jgi:hypothetical protein
MVMLSSQYLEGNASKWFESLPFPLRTQGSDFNLFLFKLQERWELQNWKEEVLKEWTALEQQKKYSDINTYNARWQELADDLGDAIKPYVKIRRYVEGLKKTTRLEIERFLLTQNPNEYDVNQIQSLAIKSEHQITTSYAPRGSGNGGKSGSGFHRKKKTFVTEEKSESNLNFVKASGSGSDQKETRKCYNCDKVGHLKKDCKAPKKNPLGKGKPHTN